MWTQCDSLAYEKVLLVKRHLMNVVGGRDNRRRKCLLTGAVRRDARRGKKREVPVVEGSSGRRGEFLVATSVGSWLRERLKVRLSHRESEREREELAVNAFVAVLCKSYWSLLLSSGVNSMPILYGFWRTGRRPAGRSFS